MTNTPSAGDSDGVLATALDWARPALVVSRVTVTQLLRKQRQSPLLLAIIVGFNLFVATVLVGVTGTGAYDLGLALTTGASAAVTEQIRSAALSGLVLVSVMHTLGAASDGRAKHRRISMLTATSTGAVVVALLARRGVASFILFGPALLAAAVAFAVGAGAPISALSLGVGSLWLVFATAVLTLPLGLVANWVVAGYNLSSGARVGLGAAVLGVFYLALFARNAVAAVLAPTPVAWAADFLLVTVPGAGANLPQAAVFAVASLVLVAAAGLACVRLAAATWYSDPAFGDEADDPAETTVFEQGFGARLHAVCSPRTAALVAMTWRRTRRTPKVLFYVYPSVFVGIIMVEQLVIHGPFSAALFPVVVGFAGATAVGSGFTLNPLGTEGDALPAVLSSGAGSARLVRAKALAAALPGAPLVVGTAVGVGVAFAAVPLVVLAGAFAYASTLVVLAPVLSQALGVHYPPDHEELLGGSVKVPNKSASAIYSFAMVSVALPGFAGLGHYAHTATLDPTVLVLGTGVTVVGALALAWASYRHAVTRLAAYSVE